MTTYGELQDRVADEIWTLPDASASPFASKITRAIQSAIAHYEREPFWFNTKISTFNTVADREYYSSSDLADIATLIQIDSATITLNDVKLPLKPFDFDKIDDWQTGHVKSLPRYFAYYKQNLRLYPIPDAAYPITLAFVFRLPALALDADANAWTTHAEQLIRSRAEAELCIYNTGDTEKAAVLSTREQQALASLKRETRLRRSDNRLRVDDMLVSPRAYDIKYQ
jgi:hypothetical protein